MTNKGNLKPIRSVIEAREKGQKGGIASGKARAEKKLLKETLEILLNMENEETGTDNQTQIGIALLKEALKGNVKAFEVIRDTLGQKPTDKQEISGLNGEPLSVKKIFITKQEQEEIDKHIDDVINDKF